MIVGKQSILFEENVYIEETACVAGQKESEGPLGKLFDVVVEDAMAGMENWEEAESTLQQLAVDKLLEKWDGKKEDLRYIFAGDLLGQLIATSFGLMQCWLTRILLSGCRERVRLYWKRMSRTERIFRRCHRPWNR